MASSTPLNDDSNAAVKASAAPEEVSEKAAVETSVVAAATATTVASTILMATAGATIQTAETSFADLPPPAAATATATDVADAEPAPASEANTEAVDSSADTVEGGGAEVVVDAVVVTEEAEAEAAVVVAPVSVEIKPMTAVVVQVADSAASEPTVASQQAPPSNALEEPAPAVPVVLEDPKSAVAEAASPPSPPPPSSSTPAAEDLQAAKAYQAELRGSKDVEPNADAALVSATAPVAPATAGIAEAPRVATEQQELPLQEEAAAAAEEKHEGEDAELLYSTMFASGNPSEDGLLGAKAAAGLLAACGLETKKLRQVWTEAKKRIGGSAPKTAMDAAEFKMACTLATQIGGTFPLAPKPRKTSLVEKLLLGADSAGEADTATTLQALSMLAPNAGGGAAASDSRAAVDGEAGVGDSIGSTASRPIQRKRGSVRLSEVSDGNGNGNIDGEWKDPLNDSDGSPHRILRGDSMV